MEGKEVIEQNKPKRRELKTAIAALELTTRVQKKTILKWGAKIDELTRDNEDLSALVASQSRRLKNQASTIDMRGRDIAELKSTNANQAEQIRDLKDRLSYFKVAAGPVTYSFDLDSIKIDTGVLDKFLITQGSDKPKPKYREGDLVRIVKPGDDQDGKEFRITEPGVDGYTDMHESVKQNWKNAHFYYHGDPEERGVWEDYLEKVKLDPKPYVGDITGKRYATNEINYYHVHFLPRPDYAKDRSVYPTPPWTAKIDGTKGTK